MISNEIKHAARVLSRYRDARRTRILRIRLRLTVRVNKEARTAQVLAVRASGFFLLSLYFLFFLPETEQFNSKSIDTERAGSLSQIEVPLRIPEANTFYNGQKGLFIIWKLAVFHPAADQIAEDASEVLVPGVAEEAARVSQHTDESRKIAVCGESRKLIDHALLMVIEPPGTSVLDLADTPACLKGAHHGHKSGIVVGIERIQDRSGQFPGIVQCAEKGREFPDGRRIANRVDAGVRTEDTKHPI